MYVLYDTKIEGIGHMFRDMHILVIEFNVVDETTYGCVCILYEMYYSFLWPDGRGHGSQASSLGLEEGLEL